LLLVAAQAVWAADEAPAWARAAAARTHPNYSSRTPAVVLLNEETLTVDTEGKRVFHEKGVIKRLTRDRFQASAGRSYDTRSGRIREIRGWAINPAGKEIRFGKDRVTETSVADARDYAEVAYKSIEPGDEVQVGGVFAYEIIEEEKSVFTQYLFRFQYALPVVESRFTLNVPAGWEASGRMFNHPAQLAKVNGNSHTWEVTNLPWVERETRMPGRYLLEPRLGVTYFPTENRAGLRPLPNWTAVARWNAELIGDRAEVTPAIQAKTGQLVAGATTELDKIRAIAAFVQQTRYVSIQLNLTRGGGYVPNKADLVLSRNYGDCKDKANLLRSLLKAAGIESYPVAIYSGARDYVSPEWPSTMQFNHAILAAKVSDASLPTVLKHPELGNLLFFDPTDPYTPVGDLPEDQQGSMALVIEPEKGGLVKVPLLPASANRIESKTTATMSIEGGIEAKILYEYFGQNASDIRGLIRQSDTTQLRKLFEEILTSRMGGLSLKSLTPTDRAKEGRLDLSMEFAAIQFGRIMQNRLLILSPGSLLYGHGYRLPAKPRTLPIKITARVSKDEVVIKTPAGFAPDEVPEAEKLESPYGVYRGEWVVAGGEVRFQQSLELNDVIAPAADYEKVRDFFEKVSGASTASVVLVRK
jgi:Domain of Unknown Function with PDB structure (DUF3857)/Transglutaminase-like superfamily